MRAYKFTCYFALLSEEENQIGADSSIVDMIWRKIITQANSYEAARREALDQAQAWINNNERASAPWFVRLCLSEEDKEFNENPINT